jgi:4-hydroxybenzoate polyprenyltransferase
VTKLARLSVVMLRYRVALMVALFMLLGAARVRALELGWRHAFAALALASSYVSATALNDLADEDIDKVNHPRDAGRPLVEGTASRRELLVLSCVATLAACVLALALGRVALAVVLVSLLVSQTYSARPVRLSYRVAGAPLVLGVAYVLVPYSLGIVAADGDLRDVLTPFTFGLFLLFSARIVLKDFRDRAGDAMFGKPTLLLRYGKTATCATSLAALVAADAVLTGSLELVPALLVQPFVAAIAAMLWRLWRSDEVRDEQIAIGTGVLLTILAWLVVDGAGGSGSEALALSGAVASVFVISFASLLREPETVAIGYKG